MVDLVLKILSDRDSLDDPHRKEVFSMPNEGILKSTLDKRGRKQKGNGNR
jgi:hypothetical protein